MTEGIISRLLRRLCANRPARLIKIHDAPYLARVYLWHRGGWRFYLHFFVSADGDRHLHDHPFHGFAVVLSGGYGEERLVSLDLPSPRIKVRQVRWFNWIPSHLFHRIASPKPGTWTLFINSPHHKRWGFLHAGNWHLRSHGIDRPDAPALMYANPYDETGVGQGVHWWTNAPTFKELGV